MVDAKVEEGWRDSLYRAYKSSQQSMRVAVYGTKHDAATFERLLRDICVFEPVTQSRASAMIDTAVLGCPKVRAPWQNLALRAQGGQSLNTGSCLCPALCQAAFGLAQQVVLLNMRCSFALSDISA